MIVFDLFEKRQQIPSCKDCSCFSLLRIGFDEEGNERSISRANWTIIYIPTSTRVEDKENSKTKSVLVRAHVLPSTFASLIAIPDKSIGGF